MPSLNGTVDGWRCRSTTNKVWYPTDGTWRATSSSLPVTANVSSPMYDDGSQSSSNKYTVCIKVTTPTNAAIGTITEIAISFYCYDRNTTSGTMYGSLRTVDPASGSTVNDTVATYRTNVAGGSAEASLSDITTTKAKHTMTFTGTFAQGTSYYLYLYTKKTGDMYTVAAHSSYYICSCTYTTKSYSVKYNANGHGTAPDSQSKVYNTNLTLRSFISNQTGTGYKVSYNANGGTTTPSASTSTLTYKQTAWNTNSSGTGTSYTSGATYTGNAALTLYAIWSTTKGSVTLASAISKNDSKSYYTISYNANGGSSTPSNQTLTRSTSYTFKKWAEGSTSGTQHSAGASYTPSAAVTMYATWTTGATTGSIKLASAINKADTTETGYTVTLNTNGGTIDGNTTLTTTNTRSYTFNKWNTAANGSGTAYSADASYSTGSNLTLYATFNSTISKVSSVSLPIPKKSGYIFLGWSTTNGGTTYVNQNYTPSGNVTLYATYKQGYYVEMYLYNGGRWINVLMS